MHAALLFAAAAFLLVPAACAAPPVEISSPPARSVEVLPGQTGLPAPHLILVYDVTGGTLTGPIHTHLAVYSDGFAAISDASRSMLSPESPEDDDGRASYKHVGAQAAAELERSLTRAEAHRIQTTAQPGCQDAPVTRVTVFAAQQGDGLRSHTYRYSCAQDERIRQVERIVRDFIREHLPGY